MFERTLRLRAPELVGGNFNDAEAVRFFPHFRHGYSLSFYDWISFSVTTPLLQPSMLPRPATFANNETQASSKTRLVTYVADSRVMSALRQKQTSGNEGLLRFRSRFFDQCRHLARVRKKHGVAARQLNDLRLGPLRHEPLEVRIDHSVLCGNHCVARLLFPSRNGGLGVKRFSCDRYLGYRHKARERLGSVRGEISWKRLGVDGQKAIANRSDALVSRRHFVRQIRQTLADVRLDGRYINKRFDVGMHSSLGNDHPAITVADKHTRTCLVENAARRGHVRRETCLRLLDNQYRVTVTLKDVRNWFPSGTIGEGAVDQNNGLDGRVCWG